MLHEYHVIYSFHYYPWFHATAVGLETYYPWIRGHRCTVLWDAMPCQLVASYQQLRGTYCLCLQGTKVQQQVPLQHQCQHYRATWHYIPETINFQGIHSSAHISAGNMLKDLPCLRETADNTECYI
jgi:hypothetical protein